jgi:predicted RNase H-like HicB family nuclease
VGVAVFDGVSWASLCPDLDVASMGPSADEALDSLEEALSDVLSVAEAEGLPTGTSVAPDDLLAFMRGHNSEAPIVGRNFYI